MAATSKLAKQSDRDIFYYRRRFLNRVHEVLTTFFEEEAERRDLTKQDIAESIGRDPAQITRWLSAPSNLTLETISDLLLSVGAEMDTVVARLSDRPSGFQTGAAIASAHAAGIEQAAIVAFAKAKELAEMVGDNDREGGDPEVTRSLARKSVTAYQIGEAIRALSTASPEGNR